MASIDTYKNKKTGEVKSYRIRVFAGRDENGKMKSYNKVVPRPVGLTPAKERKEIERIAFEFEQEVMTNLKKANEDFLDKKNITFHDFVNKVYVPLHTDGGNLKPNGSYFNKNMIQKALKFFPKKKKLSAIGVEDFSRFKKWLFEQHKANGEPYSAKSISHYYAALGAVMNYAYTMQYIEFNPYDHVLKNDKPKKPKPKVQALTREEMQEFLRCVDKEDIYWKTCIYVMALTGLRRGECVGLQWKDYDTNTQQLHVRQNVTPAHDPKAKQKYNIGTPKSDEERYVPVSTQLAQVLEEYRQYDEALKLKLLKKKLLKSDFIFHALSDIDWKKPVYPEQPTRVCKRIIEKNGLKKITPHGLRRTFSTEGARNTKNLKLLADINGQSDIETTARNYILTIDDDKAMLAQRIADNLTGTGKSTSNTGNTGTGKRRFRIPRTVDKNGF